MGDFQKALNSTSFKNQAITFTFSHEDPRGVIVDFPFYDKEVEYSGRVSRRLGYKIEKVYRYYKDGKKDEMTEESMFVTELCHNLINTSDCKQGSRVTLVFKSGTSKDGKNYSVWLLGKGEPEYNDSGAITNLLSEKDWIKLNEKDSSPETPDPIKEKVEKLKTDSDDVTSQIKALKTQLWELESKLEKLENNLDVVEEKVDDPELPF